MYAGFACRHWPAAAPGRSESAKADETPPSLNTLTAPEKAAGWQLLFDGKSTKGWRGFGKPGFPERGWLVEGRRARAREEQQGFQAGDIITVEQFDNFELKLDFKLTPRGNSGIKYLVDRGADEHRRQGQVAVSFEFQILDDELHPDAKKGKDGNRTCGGRCTT